ncbi:MAG: 30S ribosomal protein S20 [Treponemataceae bacterium]|nr:MAG: 30S ribosomal protein S20 [Treponemataceae bacterium]
MAGKQSSAEKRYKQSEVRRLRNKSAQSETRTYVRKYLEAVQSKNAESAANALQILVKQLDTNAGKGILTKNSVSRKKSRMMRLYNISFPAAKSSI